MEDPLTRTLQGAGADKAERPVEDVRAAIAIGGALHLRCWDYLEESLCMLCHPRNTQNCGTCESLTS
ncbi:hypothetical protein N0V93_009408 [Gnomoniopsis smithogilvyi]|uniref:Uncharacterized protein n=1 Tax=Gnomoniopsis smithogilvyi TaxID=1191159 RepID=A0A9W8YKF9_9PEZI|nr:hypothetical protein N0V93_009408 [Gnomoniopsis smithogilvyi]